MSRPQSPPTSEDVPHPHRSARERGLSTIAVHAGEARQKAGDSITDPIFCSATYTFRDTQSVIDYVQQKQPREEYGRYGNPSQRVVERKLAALEGGERALLFSTGMSAFVGVLMSLLSSGDEVVMFDECYHRSREFCAKHLARFGVVTRQVKTGDYESMARAISPKTRLLISESPTNPHLSVIDLERFVALGQAHAVTTFIDATLATPYNLRPLEFGVDFVLHSATKYLGGHNDLLAGAIIGRADRLAPVEKLRGVMGTINAPHSIYLLERGLKTFELRMQRHNASGQAIAEMLEQHPRVEKVFYPGLPSHRDHDIARRTMRGYGGLITFLVKDADLRATGDVVDAMQIARIAPSLGAVETLIEQPQVMSYHDCRPEDRHRWGITENMIRISCGIENTEDLIADLRQALERCP